ncbi:MAG TPA: beta-galactosidase [Polyangiaceae bacterium]
MIRSTLGLLVVVLPLAAACSSSSSDDGAGPSGGTPDGGVAVGEGGVPAEGGSADGAVDLPLPTGKFRVGSWCGLPGDQASQARMDEFAAAGFTSLGGPCSGTQAADYNAKLLEYAQKSNVTVLVTDSRVAAALAGTDVDANLAAAVADFGKSPALDGYFLGDEPGTGAFANIAAVQTKLAALDPVHFAYTNLLPNYASAGQLGTSSYDDYVNQFLTTVKPKLVSWDYYPFLSNGSDMDGFFSDMEVVRAHAVATKTPFFQFIQSISYNAHRATTESEKLWEGTQSLAYGAAGVSYFTYWTPPQASESFGTGLIDPNGNETSQYAEGTRINAKLAAWGKYLSVATSTSVFHGGGLPPGTSPRPAFAHAYVPSAATITTGTFTVNAGADEYVFVANRSYTNASEFDLYVPTTTNGPEVLDVASGAFTKATVAKSDANGDAIHVKLDPAGGVLVHLHGPIGDGAPGAEAFVGTVRADAGTFDMIDSAFGDSAAGARGWDDPCPTGYVAGGRDFQSNGFFLCVRKDLIARTFYVGNVVADAGSLWSATNGTATSQGTAGWDTCPDGSKELGRRFESNGFWLCLK